MTFNIVLVHPQIPNNTGNIGRLCLGTDCVLHLIEPLGFEITDAKLRRAGLDYWQHLTWHSYPNFDSFWEKHGEGRFWFFSAHGGASFWEKEYQKEDFFVFGREADGLPKEIREKFNQNLISIPQYSPHIRSQNLANAVAVAIYEGLRQIR